MDHILCTHWSIWDCIRLALSSTMREFPCDSASTSFVAFSTHIPHQDGAIFGTGSAQHFRIQSSISLQPSVSISRFFCIVDILPFLPRSLSRIYPFSRFVKSSELQHSDRWNIFIFSSLTLTVYHFFLLLHDGKGILLGRRQMSAISSSGTGICHKYKSN
jgi:hypothetical protein